MEIDDLKSDWNTVRPILKTDESLLLLLQENRHPVLKSIRRQIIFEVTAWGFFLVVYFSMFDGESKPIWVNLVVVLSLLVPILHSFYGYFYNKYLTDGTDIVTSLSKLYRKMKSYAFFSIIARLVFVGGLLFFFTYNIHFTIIKYFYLSLTVIFCMGQLYFLFIVWTKRLKQIKELIDNFKV
ncbi:hypothetical protein [Flavobacterium flavipallidum]|uniref:DUF3278 domain-containing protein n=1 Tax=Flavobacterium flavipallidum TaxID=3139140 RepID=A0ABU9HQ69_9FLAO